MFSFGNFIPNADIILAISIFCFFLNLKTKCVYTFEKALTSLEYDTVWVWLEIKLKKCYWIREGSQKKIQNVNISKREEGATPKFN